MIEYRALEPDEYPLLEPTGIIPDPGCSVVIGAFQGKELVGSACLVILPHIENPWVREDLRTGKVARRLIFEVSEVAMRDLGLRTLFVACFKRGMELAVRRLGFTKEPFTSIWRKDLWESKQP